MLVQCHIAVCDYISRLHNPSHMTINQHETHQANAWINGSASNMPYPESIWYQIALLTHFDEEHWQESLYEFHLIAWKHHQIEIYKYDFVICRISINYFTMYFFCLNLNFEPLFQNVPTLSGGLNMNKWHNCIKEQSTSTTIWCQCFSITWHWKLGSNGFLLINKNLLLCMKFIPCKNMLSIWIKQHYLSKFLSRLLCFCSLESQRQRHSVCYKICIIWD